MVAPPFVGRRAELASLDAALARARAGEPAAVLVGGEAGIGKSRLVEEFAHRAGEDARVVTGGCVELGADGLPFAPLTSALRGLVSEFGAGGVRELLPGGQARELARLLPALAAGATGSIGDAAGARARLFEEVLTLLGSLAGDRPVVLVVEDAHWADQSSLDLLDFLVRSQRGAPMLLLIVTYRTDELGRGHPLRPLLAQLERLRWVERLELSRLPRTDVAAQIRGLLDREPEQALVNTIHGRSQGNPLFVESLLACSTSGEDDLPESLRDLLLAPVRRLAPDTQRLLLAAATGGVRVPHALLKAISGMDDGSLTERLRTAVAGNVLTVDGDAYVFRHALIREALAAERLPGERVALHTRCAEALEADPSLLPDGRAAIETAHHWFATYDRPRALRSAWLAAGTAGKLLAHAERLHLLVRVLDLWSLVPDAAARIGIGRAALLEAAAESALLAGEHERGEELAGAALAEIDAAGEPARAAVLYERRGFARYQLGRAGDVEDLREALRLVTDPAARAPLLATLALRQLVVPLPDDARSSAEAALAAVHEANDDRAAATARIVQAVLDAQHGDLAASLPRLHDARMAGELLGARDVVTRAAHWECALLDAFGAWRQAAEAARRAMHEAGSAGLARTGGALHAADLAGAYLALGRWDEALGIAEDQLDFTPAPAVRAQLLLVAGCIRLARGELDAAVGAVRATHELLSGRRDAANADADLPLVRLEAEIRLAQGRPEEARALVEARLAEGGGALGWSAAWPFLLTAVRARSPAAAAALAGRSAFGPLQDAHRLTVTAELAGLDRAAWDTAVRAWERLEDPFGLAQALFRAAEAALAGGGDRAAAAERLRRADEVAGRLGAAPLRERIADLARRARIALAAGEEPEEDPARRLGLTARELDVLRLVAAGLGNRQIANELFISPKTASVHVSNIMAKLGVAGRGEAAAAAHRLGLAGLEHGPTLVPRG
ncbi:MAG TPA: AAA family ATPase [Candidatus Dormibacteraeota bacterium]|jgi:DNA-binding NarL/FixJ family response regulator